MLRHRQIHGDKSVAAMSWTYQGFPVVGLPDKKQNLFCFVFFQHQWCRAKESRNYTMRGHHPLCCTHLYRSGSWTCVVVATESRVTTFVQPRTLQRVLNATCGGISGSPCKERRKGDIARLELKHTYDTFLHLLWHKKSLVSVYYTQNALFCLQSLCLFFFPIAA